MIINSIFIYIEQKFTNPIIFIDKEHLVSILKLIVLELSKNEKEEPY